MNKKKIFIIIGIILLIVILLLCFRKKTITIIDSQLIKNNYTFLNESMYTKTIEGISLENYLDSYENDKYSVSYNVDIKEHIITYKYYKTNNDTETSIEVLYNYENNTQKAYYAKDNTINSTFITSESNYTLKKDQYNINDLKTKIIKDDYQISNEVNNLLYDSIIKTVNELKNLIKEK